MTLHKNGDMVAGCLPAEQLAANFADVASPLSAQAAVVEAQRCYYCYDAPCVNACPTSIDIPGFIRKIGNDNLMGAARDILSANPLGGMCARVCPTEILCEGACVLNHQDRMPVAIGALQRHATDHQMAHEVVSGKPLFARAADTGRHVAVVGAGPAGLACAHTLALSGHRVTIFDAYDKPGGLNEYGIAAYKTVDDFAQREVQWLLSIGGIELHARRQLGRDIALMQLREQFDAVFLGIGLGGINALQADGETFAGVLNAVDFIAQLRQSDDLSTLPVGHHVVVIGGGNTAIDAAVQSVKLGAQQVTMVYRRGMAQMSATWAERDFARKQGVVLREWARPQRIIGMPHAGSGDAHASAVQFETTRLDAEGRLEGTGETFCIKADVVLKAIGQTLVSDGLDAQLLTLDGARIAVDADGATSLPGVWAGGDCTNHQALDLTVQAVQDGKLAAQAIIRQLARTVAKAV